MTWKVDIKEAEKHNKLDRKSERQKRPGSRGRAAGAPMSPQVPSNSRRIEKSLSSLLQTMYADLVLGPIDLWAAVPSG